MNLPDADLEDSNVLIIKHPLRDVHHIENMMPNLACAAKLLRWCMKPGELYQLLIIDFLKGAAYGAVLDLNLQPQHC
jgi:hypothetical protein